MQLKVIQYTSEAVGHSAHKALLLADASDMGFRCMQRLYDDACDVGFELINPRTGNTTRWALLTEVRDPRENELLGWMFVPTPETIRRQPELANYQFNIVND